MALVGFSYGRLPFWGNSTYLAGKHFECPEWYGYRSGFHNVTVEKVEWSMASYETSNFGSWLSSFAKSAVYPVIFETEYEKCTLYREGLAEHPKDKITGRTTFGCSLPG